MNNENNVSVNDLFALASECREYARLGRLTEEEEEMYLEACLLVERLGEIAAAIGGKW